MEAALRAHLAASTTLTALVGTRIAWNTLPQGSTLPSVALHMVSARPDYTYDGRQGLRDSLVQIDAWGGTFGIALAVANAVIAALDVLAPPLLGVFIVNQRSSFDQGDGPQTTGTVNFHRVSLDYRVWTTEPSTPQELLEWPFLLL